MLAHSRCAFPVPCPYAMKMQNVYNTAMPRKLQVANLSFYRDIKLKYLLSLTYMSRGKISSFIFLFSLNRLRNTGPI